MLQTTLYGFNTQLQRSFFSTFSSFWADGSHALIAAGLIIKVCKISGRSNLSPFCSVGFANNTCGKDFVMEFL